MSYDTCPWPMYKCARIPPNDRSRPQNSQPYRIHNETKSKHEIGEQLTIRRKAHSLAANIPYTVVMLEQTCANDIVILISVDEGLTRGSLALEWTNAQLAAGDGQSERFLCCRRESKRDDRGQ